MAIDESLGKALYEAGWRQGVIFTCSSVEFLWNDLDESGACEVMTDAPTSATFVLVTQDCDLVSGREEYVEALACVAKNSAEVKSIKLNTSREFVVDRAAGLVADAQRRIVVAKRVLNTLTCRPWPGGDLRLTNFRTWLARRYTRSAVPDEIVVGFLNPTRDVLRHLKRNQPTVYSAFQQAVMEILIKYEPNATPPYDLRVLLLLEPVGKGGIDHVTGAAIRDVEGAIIGAVDTNLVKKPSVPFRRATGEQITLAEYYSYKAAAFDYLTYEGDTVIGAEPYRALEARLESTSD